MIAAGSKISEGLRPTLILFPLLTAALIYWNWLMIMGMRLHHPCPERCWCTTDVRVITCLYEGLQYIPENTLGELFLLTLKGNNYSVLRKDMFQYKGYSHIELLTLARCNVSFIEPGAFDHISVSLSLSLEENNITDIPSGVFNNLTALNTLNMSSNNIEVIMSKVFKGLESLESLDLQNNFIRYFETDAFWGLLNLIDLNLSSNKIIHMQSDLVSKMPRLESLDLSGNMIDIPINTEFLISDTVNSIRLANCDIIQLIENTSRNMTSLQVIGLESNRLTYVNPNTFSMLPNLSSVYLHNNPLICDCNLKETYSWFVEHNIYTGKGEFVPRCNEPSEVNGLWWGVVGSGECEDMVIKYNEDVIYEYTDRTVEDDTYTRLKYFSKFSDLVQLLMFVFGTVGNVIIILIIVCNKEFRTIPNIYIINLAIVDLMTLITGAQIFDRSTPLFQQYLCGPILYLTRISFGLTAYSVAILSIQRYEVIVRPFLSRTRNLNPRRTVALQISSVWILASLFPLTAIYCKDTADSEECLCNELIKYEQEVVIFRLMVYCILPLCVIAAMYILTASHLIRSKAVASEEIHQRRAKSRATTVKTILSLTLVFLITSVPLQAMRVFDYWYDMYDLDYEKTIILIYWRSIGLCLALCNACFNPVALFYASSSYRKCLKSFLCCCRKMQCNPSPVTSIEVISTHL